MSTVAGVVRPVRRRPRPPGRVGAGAATHVGAVVGREVLRAVLALAAAAVWGAAVLALGG